MSPFPTQATAIKLDELERIEGSFGTNGTIGTVTSDQFRPLDLTYLGTGRTEPPRFPAELLGEVWGEWCVEHARARSLPADYVAASLLAVAASLIGNSRWARISPEWTEPAALWVALVGGPSSGKSPALDPVLKIVKEIEADEMEAARLLVQEREEEIQRARASNEAWQAALRTAAKNGDNAPERPLSAMEPEALSLPRLVVGDATVERLAAILRDCPKGILINRDEIAGWIESFGRYSGASGAERAFFLEAFGGRSFRVDRQSRPEPIIIDRLSLSIVGGIQPERLGAISGGADDGFPARFLFCWPEPVLGFRVASVAVDSSKQRSALQRLADLRLVTDEAGKTFPAYVALSAVAVRHLEDFGTEMKSAANNSVGPIAGALGKAIVHAVRIALVLEYLAWSERGGAEPAEISEKAMLAGMALVNDYFVPQAKRVFREASVPPDELAIMAVAKWLIQSRCERFNSRRARRAIGGPVRDAKAMDAACEGLVEAGFIRPSPARTGGGIGRQSKDYLVNPEIFEGKANELAKEGP